MNSDIELRATVEKWHDGVDLLVRQGNAFGIAVTMRDLTQGELVKPTLSIGMKAAQVLMDDLWNSGLRPTGDFGSVGSLRATENHLRDMRTIVFKHLGIDSER